MADATPNLDRIWHGYVDDTGRAVVPALRWRIWSKCPPGTTPDEADRRKMATGRRLRFPWPLDERGNPRDWAHVGIRFDETGTPAGIGAIEALILQHGASANPSPFPPEIVA
jgi:hypothetical protein